MLCLRASVRWVFGFQADHCRRGRLAAGDVRPTWRPSSVLHSMTLSCLMIDAESATRTALCAVVLRATARLRRAIDGPVDQSSGQQLWECAVDLVRISRRAHASRRDESTRAGARLRSRLAGHLVSDAGQCGRRSCFKTAVRWCLRSITMRTLALNCRALADRSAAGVVVQRAQFVSGDWRELALRDDALEPPFDLVLAAECLYSHESTAAFVSCAEACAGERRRCVGGHQDAVFRRWRRLAGVSTRHRRRGAERRSGAQRAVRFLHVEQVREYADGKSNVRELLRVTWKSRRTGTETENNDE
jgi:hypothetical protein